MTTKEYQQLLKWMMANGIIDSFEYTRLLTKGLPYTSG